MKRLEFKDEGRIPQNLTYLQIEDSSRSLKRMKIGEGDPSGSYESVEVVKGKSATKLKHVLESSSKLDLDSSPKD